MIPRILTLTTNTLIIGAIGTAVVMILLGQITADQLLIVSAACGLLSLASLKLSHHALPKPETTEQRTAEVE